VGHESFIRSYQKGIVPFSTGKVSHFQKEKETLKGLDRNLSLSTINLAIIIYLHY